LGAGYSHLTNCVKNISPLVLLVSPNGDGAIAMFIRPYVDKRLFSCLFFIGGIGFGDGENLGVQPKPSLI